MGQTFSLSHTRSVWQWLLGFKEVVSRGFINWWFILNLWYRNQLSLCFGHIPNAQCAMCLSYGNLTVTAENELSRDHTVCLIGELKIIWITLKNHPQTHYVLQCIINLYMKQIKQSLRCNINIEKIAYCAMLKCAKIMCA